MYFTNLLPSFWSYLRGRKMNFWEIYQKLCEENDVKSAKVLTSLGLSTSMTTKWGNGSIPNGETLCKLADYFDVSIDYLLGRSKIKKPIDVDELDLPDDIKLSEGDKFVLSLLRKQPPEKRMALEHKLFAILLQEENQ